MVALSMAGVLASGARAGDDPSPPFDAGIDQCAQLACRQPGKGVLALRDGSLPFAFPRMPYVDRNGRMLLFPGDSLVFHLSAEGETLGPPSFVRDAAPSDPLAKGNKPVKGLDASEPNSPAMQHAADLLQRGTAEEQLAHEPAGTLLVHFTQTPGDTSMLLQLGHNLDRPLAITVLIGRPTTDGMAFEPTTVCTILPKLFSNETWPYPIGALMITSFKLLPAGMNTVTCQ